MTQQFVKIYGERLLNSTLWLECWQAKLVFIGMLAAADYEGFVDYPSVAALAHRLNLPISDVEKGLEVLCAADPNSRSKEEGGRRVMRVDAGWKLVNYEKYRESRSRKQVLAANRVAKFREKRTSVTCNDVTADLDLDSDKDLDLRKRPEKSARARPGPVERLPEPERGFTDRRMRSLFVAEFEAVQKTTPSLAGKHVGELHNQVTHTARLQGVDPEVLFVDSVRAWLGNPLGAREQQSPLACFQARWGSLTARGSPEAPTVAPDTIESLRAAAQDALLRDDIDAMKRFNARVKELQDEADKPTRRR